MIAKGLRPAGVREPTDLQVPTLSEPYKVLFL